MIDRIKNRRDIIYEVRVDGRAYTFTQGNDAVDFAWNLARHINKKSWESELPEIDIKLVLLEEEIIETEEKLELRCDEVLEKECEA